MRTYGIPSAIVLSALGCGNQLAKEQLPQIEFVACAAFDRSGEGPLDRIEVPVGSSVTVALACEPEPGAGFEGIDLLRSRPNLEDDVRFGDSEFVVLAPGDTSEVVAYELTVRGVALGTDDVRFETDFFRDGNQHGVGSVPVEVVPREMQDPGDGVELVVRVADGGGRVLVDSTSVTGEYRMRHPRGTEVVLTAEAAPGYSFPGWSGCAGASDEPSPTIALTLEADTLCIAAFRPAEPDCGLPLTVRMEPRPEDVRCETTFIYEGTSYRAYHVSESAFEVRMNATTSHSITSYAWDNAVQDPRAPEFRETLSPMQRVPVLASPQGVGVQVIDRCSPARTASEVVVLIQTGAPCE